MNIYLEIFGYIGTALVIFSMTRTSVKSLRIFNICGGAISTVYSIFCNAWPIVVMNVILIVINIFQLIRLKKVKASLKCVRTNFDNETVKYFFEQNGNDISVFFPDFSEKKAADVCYLTYLENEIAGIFVARQEGEELIAEIDYTTPKYRDLSVARILFSKLADDDVKSVRTKTTVAQHKAYLTKMGFTENGSEMIKEL